MCSLCYIYTCIYLYIWFEWRNFDVIDHIQHCAPSPSKGGFNIISRSEKKNANNNVCKLSSFFFICFLRRRHRHRHRIPYGIYSCTHSSPHLFPSLLQNSQRRKTSPFRKERTTFYGYTKYITLYNDWAELMGGGAVAAPMSHSMQARRLPARITIVGVFDMCTALQHCCL